MFKFLDDGIPENDFDRQLLASNLVGAINLVELNERERIITLQATKKLEINPIKGNFDYQHLKDIHKKLFENVYTFAGLDRADIGLDGVFLKGNQHFVPGNELKKYSKIIFDELKDKNFLKDCKDIDSFAKGASELLMEINALHPFREGNGRTQRIFMNELAKNAGYEMDLNLIEPQKMILASKQASQLKPQMLERLIKENITQLTNKEKIMQTDNIDKNDETKLNFSKDDLNSIQYAFALNSFNLDKTAKNFQDISMLSELIKNSAGEGYIKGEDGGVSVFQSLIELDKIVREQNEKNGTFPTHKVSFSIKADGKEYKNFNVFLGSEPSAFSKDFDYLIAIGQPELVKQETKINKMFNFIKDKTPDGKYKNIIDNSSKFVKNTIKSIAETVESLTTLSPEVQAFMRSFIQSYFKDENLQKQQLINNINKFNPIQEQKSLNKEKHKPNLEDIENKEKELFLKALSNTTKDMMKKDTPSKEKQYTRDNHSSDRNI